MQSLRGLVADGTFQGGLSERSEYQGKLEDILHSVFPQHNILTNTRKTVNVRSTETGLPLEIDAWIPDLQLAFEYQDPHHYVTYWYANLSLRHTKNKDDMKKRLLLERGETLIAIPCWWDGKEQSLVATVQEERPDLLPDLESDPVNLIPCNPPIDFFKGITVPTVGELMLASFYPNAVFNHTSWWMSEKYDGFRFCWHPVHKCLYSRFGARHELIAQKLFRFLSTLYLDGEIWFGRETFDDTQVIMNKEYDTVPWENLRFVVFDSPSSSLNTSPYEERYALLLDHVTADCPIIPTANTYLKSKYHLKMYVKSIFNNGGEGVVIRQPESSYHHGKSRSLVKFKAHRDSEGLILNVDARGHYTMQLPNGTVFVVGDAPDNATMAHKIAPKRGDIVTFSYSHLSTASGLPQGVRMLRVRRDVTWEHVAERALEHEHEKEENTVSTQMTSSFESEQRASGYWSEEENVRNFFDSFALSEGKDPLVPDTWYGYKIVDFPSGIASIVSIHGSYCNAVRHAYPEIHFIEANFKRKKNKFWSEQKNVREFFDKFAAQAQFDPLLAENWYNIFYSDIAAAKNGYSVLTRYNQVYSRAVMDAYPDLSWDVRNFRRQMQYATMPMESRKFVLDSIANKRGFDPLVARNWYSISCVDILKHPGGASLLRHYNGGLIRALTHVYPSIGLDPLKFKKVALQYRAEPSNLRRMLDNIAKQQGFDPLIAEDWCSVSRVDLLKHKGMITILRHYKSVGNLVKTVYPTIIDTNEFTPKAQAQ
eukprot:Phypoly_transcript_03705.p1 GENE.Phypoly_transcript_03705~~Phypoly_transcript_03705.p1  ORF type:complete len:765 (+),score=83.89 Phypoly_transcript_03705:12-2306(+)